MIAGITIFSVIWAVADRSMSLAAPENTKRTANKIRPNVTNAGIIGLSSAHFRDGGNDYGRSAQAFQTVNRYRLSQDGQPASFIVTASRIATAADVPPAPAPRQRQLPSC